MIVWAYKDKFARLSVLLRGIVLLLLVNGIFVVAVWRNQIMWGYIVIVALIGLIMWRKIRLFTTMRYEVTPTELIILYGRKRYPIPRDRIVESVTGEKVKRWTGRGVQWRFWQQEVRFTTSLSWLTRLTMDDGKNVLVSLKEDVL